MFWAVFLATIVGQISRKFHHLKVVKNFVVLKYCESILNQIVPQKFWKYAKTTNLFHFC